MNPLFAKGITGTGADDRGDLKTSAFCTAVRIGLPSKRPLDFRNMAETLASQNPAPPSGVNNCVAPGPQYPDEIEGDC